MQPNVPLQEPVPKPRRNVAFINVPDPTPPPLLEWQNGIPGRLEASDFDLRDPALDLAWWERPAPKNGKGKRREKSGAGAEEPITTTAAAAGLRRPVPKQNTPYDPPLTVECGPLLRYTGIRTEPIGEDDNEQFQSDEETPLHREIWHGTIMIVTRDSASTYSPPPTLTIYAQPRTLLPPPPAVIRPDTGERLAPEYVDPVAGVAKTGRNGRMLFVKPIDYVDEGLDLSGVEDDGGLFETSPSALLEAGHQAGGNYAATAYTAAAAAQSTAATNPDGEMLGRMKRITGVRLHVDPARDLTFWRFSIQIELRPHAESRIAYRINGGSPTGFWVPPAQTPMNIACHAGNGFSAAASGATERNRLNGPDPMWRDLLNAHQTRPFHALLGAGDQVYGDGAAREPGHFHDWMGLRVSTDNLQHPFNEDIRGELESFYLERYLHTFSTGLFSVVVGQIPMVNMWNDHEIIDGYGSFPHPFQKTPVFSGVGNVAFKYYLLFQHQSVPEETPADEPSWLLGTTPGPYIKQKSRNVMLSLGGGVSLLAIDCRTERTVRAPLSPFSAELSLQD